LHGRSELKITPTIADPKVLESVRFGTESKIVELFPQVTAKQIQKLFPKNMKLKIPDLSAVDNRLEKYIDTVIR
jgi:hypothetical protein